MSLYNIIWKGNIHAPLDLLEKSAAPTVRIGALFESQKSAVVDIIREIQGQAVQSWNYRNHPKSGDVYAELGYDIEECAPHNVFMIDGARGSGKTSLLLTLKRYLRLLRLDTGFFNRSSVEGGVPNQERVKRLRDMGLPSIEDRTSKRSALVLPVIFPDHSTEEETAMDLIFALVETELKEAERDAKRGSDEAQLRKIEECRKTLREEVMVGWIFSRGQGMQALLNDAMDYKDFADSRARFNRRSARRVKAWNRFVDQFLDVLNFEMFVPLFDDADLHPRSGKVILDDIRMYLAHRRIAVVVAVDMGTLVEELVVDEIGRSGVRNLAQIGQVERIRQAENSSAFDSGKYLDHVVERTYEKLGKIFPTSKRYRVDITSRAEVDRLNPVSLSHLCAAEFRAYSDLLDDRLDERLKMSKPKDGAVDLAPPWPPFANEDKEDIVRLEKLSWWLLSATHSAVVIETVRGYMQFLHGVVHRQFLDGVDGALAWANHEFADHGQGLAIRVLLDFALSWPLRETGAIWNDGLEGAIGGRPEQTTWKVDGAQHGRRGTKYCDRMIDFWFDVQVAQAGLDISSLPYDRWLPHSLRFLPANFRMTKDGGAVGLSLGVRTLFPESFLPRSCLYTYQLRHLDDLINEIMEMLPDFLLESTILEGFEEKQVGSYFTRAFNDLIEASNWSTGLKFLARAIRNSNRIRTLSIDSMNEGEQTMLVGYAAVFAAMRGDPGRVLSDLKDVFQLTRDVPMVWEEIREFIDGEQLKLFNEFEAFIAKARWVGVGFRRERVLLRSQWFLALQLGDFGGDFDRISPLQKSRKLGTALDQAELGYFVRGTKNIAVRRSVRTGILMAWSIATIAEKLFRIGVSLDEIVKTKIEHWRAVREAMGRVLCRYECLEDWKRKGCQYYFFEWKNDAPPPTIYPKGIEDSNVNPETIDRSKVILEDDYDEALKGFVNRGGPEAYLQPSELLDWYFPDFAKGDLNKIISEIKAGVENIDRLIVEAERVGRHRRKIAPSASMALKAIAEIFNVDRDEAEQIHAELKR